MKIYRSWLIALSTLAMLLVAAAPVGFASNGAPSDTQSDASYAASYAANNVTNVVPTSQKVSCYTPEAPFFAQVYPDGGMSACPGANTGENLGPYATQAGSNPGYPAANDMLVKDHSESDIRVDPTNAS